MNFQLHTNTLKAPETPIPKYMMFEVVWNNNVGLTNKVWETNSSTILSGVVPDI